ncbi:MAG: hypothetical protein U0792_16600 [Gemmataceae bacterium]
MNGGYSRIKLAVDAGLYLIKSGRSVEEPGQMLLIKNDPVQRTGCVPSCHTDAFTASTSRRRCRFPANDGKLRHNFPPARHSDWSARRASTARKLPQRSRKARHRDGAAFAGGPDPTGTGEDLDPFNTTAEAASLNWFNQGGDAGRYTNDDIPRGIDGADDRPQHRAEVGPRSAPRQRTPANPGRNPLRKFTGENQPTDPDGNPDTSFLAKIPADVGFTFQTLDKHGMVLNMAQTWHQACPGEIRHDVAAAMPTARSRPSSSSRRAARRSRLRRLRSHGEIAAAHEQGQG